MSLQLHFAFTNRLEEPLQASHNQHSPHRDSTEALVDLRWHKTLCQRELFDGLSRCKRRSATASLKSKSTADSCLPRKDTRVELKAGCGGELSSSAATGYHLVSTYAVDLYVLDGVLASCTQVCYGLETCVYISVLWVGYLHVAYIYCISGSKDLDCAPPTPDAASAAAVTSKFRIGRSLIKW